MQLIQAIIDDFRPKFALGAEVLYRSDTPDTLSHLTANILQELELEFDNDTRFPDVILYRHDKGWLFLIDSSINHGPICVERHAELARLFTKATAGLVYVTAFPDHQTMGKHLSEISWETEVWVAETPTHMIHFDGKRFLGPYNR